MASVPRILTFASSVHPQDSLSFLQLHHIVIRQDWCVRLGERRTDGWPTKEPVSGGGMLDRQGFGGRHDGRRIVRIVRIALVPVTCIRAIGFDRAARALSGRLTFVHRRPPRFWTGRALREAVGECQRCTVATEAWPFAEYRPKHTLHVLHPVRERGQMIHNDLVCPVGPINRYQGCRQIARTGRLYLAGATV